MQRQGIVPWSKLEAFVKLYDKTIQSLIDNEKDGIITKAQIEPLLPGYFKKLYSTLATFLSDHVGEEIKKEEEELEKNKVYMIIKVM